MMSFTVSCHLLKTTDEDQKRFHELARKVNGPLATRSVWILANLSGEKLDEGSAIEIGRALVVLYQEFATIEYIFVEQERRKNQVGRAIVDEAMKYVAARGANRILTSTQGSHESLEFWRRCGYQVIGTSLGTTERQNVYYLEKRI